MILWEFFFFFSYSGRSSFYDQIDWMAIRFFTPPVLLFPKTSNQSFEIAILISIIERSSGDDMILLVLGEKILSYEICLVFTYGVIGK